MRTQGKLVALSAVALMLVLTGGMPAPQAHAALISVNFAENDANQGFAGGQDIGPLRTNSSNWNNTVNRDSGTLISG